MEVTAKIKVKALLPRAQWQREEQGKFKLEKLHSYIEDSRNPSTRLCEDHISQRIDL